MEYLPKSSLWSSSTIEKLPSIKLADNTKINTIPGGSKSVTQDALNVEVDETPMPETNSHPVHLALLQIEKVIGTRKHLYINRLPEGYDASCDSLYI